MASTERGELLLSHTESAAIHSRYATERPGSLGGFGSVSLDEAVKQIQASQGPVWRVIVSVAEADALAMGGQLTTRQGWQAAAEQAVPVTVRRLGLDPDRTEWMAAAHRWQAGGERNPHLHLLIWQRGEPARKTGRWTLQELRAIKRAWARTLYAPELARLGAEKTAARQAAREAVTAWRTGPGAGVEREWAARLQALRAALPERGQLAWDYLPSEAKTRVADTLRWLPTVDPSLADA